MRWVEGPGPEGEEPDPRFTLANERTFLAWIRTALALVASGIGLEAFVPRLALPGFRQALAVCLVLPIPIVLRILMAALVLLGALSVGAAYGDELRDRRFRQHGLTPPPAQPPPSGQW